MNFSSLEPSSLEPSSLILILRTVQNLLKRPSVAWKKHTKYRFGLFDWIATQNIQVETYFILILETRIARLESSIEARRLEAQSLESLRSSLVLFDISLIHPKLIINIITQSLNIELQMRLPFQLRVNYDKSMNAVRKICCIQESRGRLGALLM